MLSAAYFFPVTHCILLPLSYSTNIHLSSISALARLISNHFYHFYLALLSSHR